MRRVFNVAIGITLATLVGSSAASAQGLEFLHDQRAEGGRSCFNDHFHYSSGSGATKAAAEKEAIASWSSFTAWEYGDRWGSWRLAGSKKVTCTPSGGSVSCSVEARPCRPLAAGGGVRRPRPRPAAAKAQ